MCVKEAIEAGVVHLIVQGLKDQVWMLKNASDIQTPLVQRYMNEAEPSINTPARETKSVGVESQFNATQ
jgi:curli production assembly/transport component CsgG